MEFWTHFAAWIIGIVMGIALGCGLTNFARMGRVR